MKTIRLAVVGVVVMWALPLVAFLPPDAQFRQQEFVRQRVRARIEYEQRQKEYEKEIIANRIRTEAIMKTPPWMGAEGNKVRILSASELGLKTTDGQKIYHRLLVSAVLLILIGVGVGWVRYATRKADE